VVFVQKLFGNCFSPRSGNPEGSEDVERLELFAKVFPRL
jgi:hypothetical protein